MRSLISQRIVTKRYLVDILGYTLHMYILYYVGQYIEICKPEVCYFHIATMFYIHERKQILCIRVCRLTCYVEISLNFTVSLPQA